MFVYFLFDFDFRFNFFMAAHYLISPKQVEYNSCLVFMFMHKCMKNVH